MCSRISLLIGTAPSSYRAARRYAPPPIVADLRPRADGSAVLIALVAWRRRRAPRWPMRCAPRPSGTDRQTDGRTDGWRHRVMPPPHGGVIIIDNNSLPSHCILAPAALRLQPSSTLTTPNHHRQTDAKRGLVTGGVESFRLQ